MEPRDAAAVAGGAGGEGVALDDVSAATLRLELSRWFGVPPHIFQGISHATLRELVAEVRGTPSRWDGVLAHAGRDDATVDLAPGVRVRGR